MHREDNACIDKYVQFPLLLFSSIDKLVVYVTLTILFLCFLKKKQFCFWKYW